MTATRTLAHGLGILGLIPFVALAVLIATAPTETPLLSGALLYYGATILAFMGGVYWGLALRADESVHPAFLALTRRSATHWFCRTASAGTFGACALRDGSCLRARDRCRLLAKEPHATLVFAFADHTITRGGHLTVCGSSGSKLHALASTPPLATENPLHRTRTPTPSNGPWRA